MTIPEAVSLILQAAAMGKGGEIFVLDMGKPMRIQHLAEEMIRLSGREPGRDIRIEHIGLRAGEKLHEGLFYDSENPVGTGHPKILWARGKPVEVDVLDDRLKTLETACDAHDERLVRTLLGEVVPEFQGGRVSPSAAKKMESESSVRVVNIGQARG